ncbi:MAG: helix-turn-helix transcriptional regulator, partial [Armatimonadetes bacterium]|nr:helix-turn-helix transcriptional regulator [Candidatus Hippobium faecium]
INRILVHIYSMSKNRPALLKSFLMELIVTMSRTAVEAGADPSDLLGTNYSAMEQLAKITSDEELSSWVVEMLEKIIEAINKNKIYPNSVLLEKAVRYMHEHLKEDLKRDTVAAQACLSPSHFSKVIKETFGMTYTDLVSKLRVEKAKELLKMTKIPIAQIAFECGFNDQSYFTKVFLKYTKMTPGACRRGR